VATVAEQRGVGGFLLTCMGFDPADGTPLALKVMRAGGVSALGFLLSFLGWLALRDARRRRRGGGLA
jgi:protein SCO1/2